MIQNKINIKYNFIQFSNKIWLQIILNFEQNEVIQEKIKAFFKRRLFSIHNTIKIYTSYNWNKFFFKKKYNFWRKTKNQDDIVLKKFTQIFFLHTVAKKYAKLKKDGKTIKAAVYKPLLAFDTPSIIGNFSKIICKIAKYHLKYILYYNIRFIIFIFRKTCALTVANKHRTKTSAAGLKKFENLI